MASTTCSRTLMMVLKRCCGVLLVTVPCACGGTPSTPAAPLTPTAPAPVAPHATNTFHATGIVTDDDGSPVPGATVSILSTSISGLTDASGSYSIDFEATGSTIVGWVKAEAAGHDMSYRLLQPSVGQNVSQDLHLYRIKRVTAGESSLVTVVAGDTFCGEDDQFQCRTVHVVAPADGSMTIEAVPTPPAANAGLELAGRGSAYHCCALTTSLPVTAGTEVIANIGMWWSTTASQSFVLNTTLVRP